MTNLKKQIRKYTNKIFSSLPCSLFTKIVFIKKIKNDISLYLSSNPTANIEEIKNRFGQPDDIASNFSNFETNELLHKSKRLKFTIYSLIIAIIILIISSILIIQHFGGFHERV